MSDHKVRLALLNARTRRMLRHTSDPVERALALVVIARAAADHAAVEASLYRNSHTLEVTGCERVLTAALQHLHDVRRASQYRRTSAADTRSKGA
jgi:hypothetical protein